MADATEGSGPVDVQGVPEARAAVDAQGVVVSDQECKRCGYNLRGLQQDGCCPECATPVAFSIRGDLLRFSDPTWVAKVARGLSIILWMILVAILMRIATGALVAVLGPGSEIVTPVVNFAVALLSFYGVWLITTPDPSGVGEDPNLTVRKVVRIALVVGLTAIPLQAVSTTSSVPYGAGRAAWGAIVVVGLFGLVGEFAKFIYYERLARRIPDVALAKRARFLRWAFTITLGGTTLMSVAAAFLMRPMMTLAVTAATMPTSTPTSAPSLPAAIGPVMGFGCFGGVLAIAFLVFAFMTLSMLLRLRKAVAEQARNAQRLWTAAVEDAGAAPPARPL